MSRELEAGVNLDATENKSGARKSQECKDCKDCGGDICFFGKACPFGKLFLNKGWPRDCVKKYFA
jgi:hypothetical protein